MTIPFSPITVIPDTEPDAIPSLWNTRYEQIDQNFNAVEAEIEELRTDVDQNISGADTAVAVKDDWKYNGKVMYVEKWMPSWTLFDPTRPSVLGATVNSTTITVVSTTGLIAGLYYNIINPAGGFEQIRIAAINSDVQFSVINPLVNTYPLGSVVSRTTFEIYPGIAVARNDKVHYFGPLDAGDNDSVQKLVIRRSYNASVLEVWFYNEANNPGWTFLPAPDRTRYAATDRYEVEYDIRSRGNTYFGLKCLDSTQNNPIHISGIYFYEPNVFKTIVTDTRFYVTLTGSDTSGAGTLLSPWATLTHAMQVLQSYWIASSATVTIELGDGYHAYSNLINLGHPCGSRIVITGKNCYEKTVSSLVGCVEDSHDAYFSVYRCVFTLVDVTDIAANDFLCLTKVTSGQGAMQAYLGGHRVESVNTTLNQVTLIIRRATTNMPTSTVCTITAKVIKTVVLFNSEIGLFLDEGNSIGAIRDIVIAGNNVAPQTIGAGGISVWNGATARLGGTLVVGGFQVDGISCRNLANVILETDAFCSINGCATGIQLVGNSFFGINWGTLVVYGLVTGINCTVSSSFHANKNSRLYVLGNVTYGIGASTNGFVHLGVTTVFPLVVEGNALGGNGCSFIASTGGFINITWAPCIPDGCTNGILYSPLRDTLGNTQGYINAAYV